MGKTNILLLTSDQQHWCTLGANNPDIKTPNLDKLAGRGVRFERAYCVNPTCTPSRASIITGQYPSQHGAWSLGTKLPEDVHTVGEDFSANGYTTALIGKAHFQPLKSVEEFPSLEAYPLLQDKDFWRNFDKPFYGFDRIELARNHADESHVGQHYALWMEEKGFSNWRKSFQRPTGTSDSQKHVWNIPEEYHYNAWIAERSIAIMEESAKENKPFFLWSSFFDPHPPYLVPEPWASMYDPADIKVPRKQSGEHEKNPPYFREAMKQFEDFDYSEFPEEKNGNALHGIHGHKHHPDELAKDIAIYYGMVSMMDACIGKILDRLDELGLTDNTLVLFTTDHGHFFGQHGLVAKGPFHYEDMVKIPWIASLPGKLPQGKTSGNLQSHVDIAPTFLDFCGIPVPRSMTGTSRKEEWTGAGGKPREQVIVENHHNPTTVHLKTLVTERYKITVHYNKEYGELFDLENDPDEVNNLWDDPAFKEHKSRLLLQFMHAEMGKEPMWMPRIANA